MPESPPDPIILQDHLAVTPWTHPQLKRLPGILPIPCKDWLLQDEAYAGQMALRDHLIAARRADVFAMSPEAESGAGELRALLWEELPGRPGYQREGAAIRRPDGALIGPDDDHPLIQCGRLVQEDLCLLSFSGPTPILSGAVLCFPAHWTLAQKITRPLIDIHTPVDDYSAEISRRVDRMIGNIRPETALMRANFLIYTDPALHQPAPEYASRIKTPHGPRYVRVERQTLRRLPLSGLVVFAIHTHLLRTGNLPPEDFEELARLRPDAVAAEAPIA